MKMPVKEYLAVFCSNSLPEGRGEGEERQSDTVLIWARRFSETWFNTDLLLMNNFYFLLPWLDFQKPLFKKNITSLKDLHPGAQLSGRVMNMTSFGAFVDCGVGLDGLVHNNDMRQFEGKLGLGDLVEVTVESVDTEKQQFSLVLKKISSSFNPELLISMGN